MLVSGGPPVRGSLQFERFRHDTNRRHVPDIGSDRSERALHRSLSEVKTFATGLRNYPPSKKDPAAAVAEVFDNVPQAPKGECCSGRS